MLKIIKIIILFIVLVFARQAGASMNSDNYKIWIDTFSGGGGNLESDGYKIDSSISSQLNKPGQSANLREKPGFTAIGSEPTVGFSVQSIALNFGELSPSATAYSSHTLSAYTNSKSGYSIKVYGQPLHTSYHDISAIGNTPQDSAPGTEQFGLNLVSNTVPVVGQAPLGGSGQPAVNYNTTNKYAYQEGDVITQSASYTYQTDYTVSVVINISEETPSGAYGTILTYEFIPVF
jgi:hypothetical protein